MNLVENDSGKCARERLDVMRAVVSTKMEDAEKIVGVGVWSVGISGGGAVVDLRDPGAAQQRIDRRLWQA
jgi:hypothetical protein